MPCWVVHIMVVAPLRGDKDIVLCHVCTRAVRREIEEWEWRMKVLQKSLQTTEKWRWKKFSAIRVVLIGATRLYTLPLAVRAVAVSLQNTLCRPVNRGLAPFYTMPFMQITYPGLALHCDGFCLLLSYIMYHFPGYRDQVHVWVSSRRVLGWWKTTSPPSLSCGHWEGTGL